MNIDNTLKDKLVIALSSRALFNFERENEVFEEGDDRQYMRLQLENIEHPAEPGVAFSLVKKLLVFNNDVKRRVEVVILSRNDPVSGMRVFRSARHYELAIDRGVFTRGRSPFRYLVPLQAHLFLSANEVDVKAALDAGFAAARVYPTASLSDRNHEQEIRIAFDGDAVLFDDTAEKVYRNQGLHQFLLTEDSKSKEPLNPGPFKPLLAALHELQLATVHSGIPMRIRTALVTARSAPAHERALRTLMAWNIEVDEAFFLGGLDKGVFLREFEPDFYFDDHLGYCDAAAKHSPTGHVTT